MSVYEDYLKAKQKQGITNQIIRASGHTIRADQISIPDSTRDDGLTDAYNDYLRTKADIANTVSGSSKLSLSLDDIGPVKDDEIAPVKDKEEEDRTWFKKSSLFDDGYNFGDVTRTILGTAGDVVQNVGAGILGMGEKALDAFAYISPYVAQGQMYSNPMSLQQMEQQEKNFAQSKKEMQEFIKKDLYDESALAQKAADATIGKLGVDTDEHSVFGAKTDALAQSGGQLLGTALLQAAGLPWWMTTGTTSFGGETENAFKNEASYEEAGLSAAITAGAEMLTEKISGGIKFGGKTLDEGLTKKLAANISNKVVRTLTKLGMDMAGEGAEEVLSGAIGAVGQKITYADDKELNELFSKEDAWESFIGGAVLGGLGGANRIRQAKNSGVDYVTKLTSNEQKVFDKVYQEELANAEKIGKVTQSQKTKIYDKVLKDMERGYISTETIEDALGGEKMEQYKKEAQWEKSVQDNYDKLSQEYDELYNMKNGEKSSKQVDREAELKEMLPKLKKQLDNVKATSTTKQTRQEISKAVQEMVRGERLTESYSEVARAREDFQSDLKQFEGSKHPEAAKEAIESAIKAGANNTNRVHDFVEMVAKTASETGLKFQFKSGEQVKTEFIEAKTKAIKNLEAIPEEQRTAEQSKKLNDLRDLVAKVESGETKVNGNLSNGVIELNLDSAKPLNRVVGHEVTHSFEPAKGETSKDYDDLKKHLFSYAETKGINIQQEIENRKLTYEGITDADPEAELVADLVGDFLFTDPEYVKRLSTENRTGFQKIFDEIKHLYKMATAGSKEARELERVKKAFEDAYREVVKSDNAKYSLEQVDGTSYVKAEKNIFTKEDGTAASEREIFNSLVGKTISLPEGDVKIVKRLPGKDMYNELARRYPKHLSEVEDAKQLNKSVNQNMEELLASSEASILNQPDTNGRHQRQGITSFDTRTVKFFDGDKAYDIEFSIATLQNGEKVAYAKKFFGYDEELTKKIQVTEARSEQSPLNRQPVSSNKLAQNSGNVKYSLTAEQQEYFKDSVVRDEDGNLKVMYHGTSAGGHTVFDPYGKAKYGLFGAGSYFTDNKAVAESYTTKGKGKNPQVYETYLNIKNPMDMDAAADPAAWAKAFPDASFPESGTNEQFYRAMEEYFEDEMYPKWEAAEEAMMAIEDMGFDGITHIGGGRFNKADETRHRVYIAFQPEQIKNVTNQNPTDNPDINLSLSNKSEGFAPVGSSDIFGKDILRSDAEVAPVAENATTETSNVTPNSTEQAVTQLPEENSTPEEDLFPDDLAPMPLELDRLMGEQSELRQALESAMGLGDYNQISRLTGEYESVTARIRELEAQESERVSSIDEADMPPETELYPGEPNEPMEPADPFADRDMVEVGKRNVKAYMDEHPEVKPFFKTAAEGMLGDLSRSIKGERLFNDQVYYDSGGENGWMGTKRSTTSDIADLLDNWGASYAQIEEALNSIIEDGNKNALAKRIEFMLDDRLRNGYTDVYGEYMPPDQGYIDLLNDRVRSVETREAFDNLVRNGDQYAPPDDIGPVTEVATKTTASGQEVLEEMRIAPEPQGTDDIAPTYDVEGKKGVPDGQQAFMPDAGVPKRITKKELHTSIMDKIKAAFASKGYDFDKVLDKAKNLSTFATVDNTPQRVMEKELGYKEGGILADLTINKVAQNETQGIRWLNSFTDRKNGLLSQISKQYRIKPGSKESAAAQMYAEGFYVDENDNIISYGDKELAADFPDAATQHRIKGLAGDPRIRQIYDETLNAINESRVRNGYPEIPRLDNYFLHFRAMEDTFSRLGLPFNPNDIRAKDLPTDLNGVTADLKPGQPFFASAMHRTGMRTSFDMLGGLEKYLSSAKNQIYHIDDIQTFRALRNYIADSYGQAKGLESLDTLSDEEAQHRIEQVYDSHLSTFAKFLNEEANVLAGKTSLTDRGIEGVIGRRGITFLETLNRQVGANMVGFNVASAGTNFLSVFQAMAKSNKFDFVKAFAQASANQVQSIFGKSDGFAENSPVIIRRKGAESFYRTPWQKAGDMGYGLMSVVDNISTELIARTKYNELTRKGMDSQTAHFETDKWVSKLMGDRSLGQQPQLYNSKMLGLLTKFQLEVRNQLDSQFYDTIQEAKVSTEDIQNGLVRNAKKAAKIGSTFVQLAVLQHMFGAAYESVAGYNPAFDIIDVIIKAFGLDDDEEDEDTALDNIEEGFMALLGDMPYSSILTGGRIPISSALPVNELIKGEDQYGNEKSRWDTIKETAPYYFMPGGYGQIKKTAAGLGMFDEDLPIAGSYTDSDKLRFPVEDTPSNRVQAAVFGQWASDNARDYIKGERKPLNEKQIEEFVDLDIPIQQYWKIQDGLSGLDTLNEQAEYIANLDLPLVKKNQLINNRTDRKEYINLNGYNQYGDFEEFDFAVHEPEKYEVALAVGGYDKYVSYMEGMKGMDKLEEKIDYIARLDLTTAQKNRFVNSITTRKEPIDLTGYENYGSYDEWDYAKKYPKYYSLAKVMGGYETYYNGYYQDLKGIESDKDQYGDSISGSKKPKVRSYVYSLDIPDIQKHILFKSQYNSDNSHNREILDYLNNNQELTYEEKVYVLDALGAKVLQNGSIKW